MNVEHVIRQLQIDYPGKPITEFPQDTPTVISCELDPPTDHPDYRVTISCIDELEGHAHPEEETIEVLRGNLLVVLNGRAHSVATTESVTVPSGFLHSATGDQTIVRRTLMPVVSANL